MTYVATRGMSSDEQGSLGPGRDLEGSFEVKLSSGIVARSSGLRGTVLLVAIVPRITTSWLGAVKSGTEESFNMYERHMNTSNKTRSGRPKRSTLAALKVFSARSCLAELTSCATSVGTGICTTFVLFLASCLVHTGCD